LTHLKTSRLSAIGAAVVYILLSVAPAHAQPQTPDARSLLPTLLDEVVARAKQRLIEAEARTRPLLDEIESQIELPELRAPAAEAVRAYDRPSDDGSAIIIEWLAPDRKAELRERATQQAMKLTDNPTLADSLAAIVTEELFVNVTYLVEVAKSSEDLAAGRLKTIPVTPGAATRKSGDLKYFGLDGDNADYCYAEIIPSKLFSPPLPKPITVQQYERLFVDGTAARVAAARAADEAEDTEAPAGEAADGLVLSDAAMQDLALALISAIVEATGDEVQLFMDAVNKGYLPEDAPFVRQIRLYAAITQGVTDGVLDEQHRQRAVLLLMEAVLRQIDEEPEGGLSPAELAEREWLAGVELLLRLDRLVTEGFLTDKEAARVRDILPLADQFEQDVAEATVLAESAKEEADQAEQAARAARQAAEKALDDADDETRPQAAEDLKTAVADEKLAKAAMADAKKDLLWTRERIRRTRPRQERRELDWLARLQARLKGRDDDDREDAEREINAKTYYFRLAISQGERKVYVTGDRPVVGDEGGAVSVDVPDRRLVLSASAHANAFKWFRMNTLVFALVFSGIVLCFIHVARRNPNLFLRKIAGLDAVEEAIGRATEMGRPAFYIHGYGGPGSMSVIAAINILSRVARQAADYDTRIRVMNLDPIVTAVSQEVVQQAYIEAGRPDAYDADDVAFMTAEQFSYAAAVAGRMVREKPAAIFLMGYFMAESLLLAETGASTGAIQVAGTDAEHQLPFFITTCDYTLIGEELYAASAYLSREPRMLGSLRGQDVGKAFMMVAIVLGVIVLTTAAFFAAREGHVEGWPDYLAAWIGRLFEAIS